MSEGQAKQQAKAGVQLLGCGPDKKITAAEEEV